MYSIRCTEAVLALSLKPVGPQFMMSSPPSGVAKALSWLVVLPATSVSTVGLLFVVSLAGQLFLTLPMNASYCLILHIL